MSNALPIGSGELATLDEHTETISVPANTHQGVTAACESGETVVSGGWRWTHTGPSDVEVREDHREGNGWRASGRNDTNSPKELRVHAYCLTAG